MSNIHDPMLAAPLSFEEIEKKAAGYYMEVKLDGVRCIADIRDPANPKLVSRGGKELTAKLPHIVEQLVHNFPGMILDGELGYTNKLGTAIDFNLTMRVLGSGVDEALRKQKHIVPSSSWSDAIEFNVFDLLWLSSDIRTVSAWERFKMLMNETPLFATHLRHIRPVEFRFEWMEGFYDRIVEAGGEGVILKNPDAPYLSGARRAKTWYKLKKYITEDVQVVGYTEGQGKYFGQIGAIIFGHFVEALPTGEDAPAHEHVGFPCLVCKDRVKPVPLGKCSGMTDETRTFITNNQKDLLGRWFELRFFGKVGKDEDGYRFPQFLRWRFDK